MVIPSTSDLLTLLSGLSGQEWLPPPGGPVRLFGERACFLETVKRHNGLISVEYGRHFTIYATKVFNVDAETIDMIHMYNSAAPDIYPKFNFFIKNGKVQQDVSILTKDGTFLFADIATAEAWARKKGIWDDFVQPKPRLPIGPMLGRADGAPRMF
jgi:hypothetical protein